MKVLVIGATGFVGTAIVTALRQSNHEVVGLTHTPTSGAHIEKLGVTLLSGDMLRPDTYVPAVAEVDVVIHAAQYGTHGRLTRRRFAQIEQADEVATHALADACLQHNKKLIYTSGCFNYGDHGDQWITDATPFVPSPLGRGHARMATLLTTYFQQRQLRVVILSPGFVYGPGGLFKQSFYDTYQKGQLHIFGKGQNYWSQVHVADLAAAYLLACASDAYGETFNIVDDEPLQLHTLVDQFTDALEKPHVSSMAPWLLKFFIGGPLVDSLVISFRVKNDKARTVLKWQPYFKTFQEGIPSVIATLRGAHN